MYTYYVPIDDDGYPTAAPVTDKADGLVAFIAYTTIDKEYFLRSYDKYRRDENGNWAAPGNLPDLGTSELLRSQRDQAQVIDSQKDIITTLQNDLATTRSDADAAKTDAATAKESLTKANATIESLQQMAGQLTAQSVTYQSTIKDLQSLAGQLTAQIVQLQAAGATDTTKE